MSTTDTGIAESSATPDQGKKADKPKNTYIVGPLFDMFFFIGSPLLAMAVGWIGFGTPATTQLVDILGIDKAPLLWFGALLTFSHLWLVFARSHGNPTVFKRFPYRFTVVPVVLAVALYSSIWVSVCLSVLATFWDVYHSGLQTFGLGRIYDAKRGNDPTVGRSLDVMLNHVLYMGPVIGGAMMFEHIAAFGEFKDVNAVFLSEIPYYALGYSKMITNVVLAVAIPCVGWYLWSYYRLWTQGYKVSWQKVALLSTTALTSVWAWGFNAFGLAFMIMNLFHAVQYFALVWVTERHTLAGRVGIENTAWGPNAAYAFVVALCLTGGLATIVLVAGHVVVQLGTWVSLLHFWYDGFIWSVRKKMV